MEYILNALVYDLDKYGFVWNAKDITDNTHVFLCTEGSSICNNAEEGEKYFISRCKEAGYKNKQILCQKSRVKDGSLNRNLAYELLKTAIEKIGMSKEDEIRVRALLADDTSSSDAFELRKAITGLLNDGYIDRADFICEDGNSFKPERITSFDYIYNRPELFAETFEKYDVQFDDSVYEFKVVYNGNEAKVACGLTDIPGKAMLVLCKKIFGKHHEVKAIKFTYAINKAGDAETTNFFVLTLPGSREDLAKKLGKADFDNLQNKLNEIKEDKLEIEFKEFSSGNIPGDVMHAMFSMSRTIHDLNREMTTSQYMADYHGSNAYALYLNKEVAAVAFTCEQCDAVSFDNLAYDKYYEKYTLELLLYNYVLNCLIAKGKKAVTLGSGHKPIKFLYGAYDYEVYNCTVNRDHVKKMNDKPALVYLQYFSRKREDLAGLDLIKNDKFEFVRIEDPEEYIDFCGKYNSSIYRQVIPRFYKGYIFFALVNKDTRVSGGWAALNKLRMNEVRAEADLEKAGSCIFFDFYTEDGFRKQDAHAYLLQQMMLSIKEAKEYVAYASPDNTAAIEEIRKAGFEADGTYSYQNINELFEAKGWN